MKLAIVGTGMIVQEFLPYLSALPLEKAVIYGRNVAKTTELAEKFSLSATYTDYGELLASDIDTVYIALPNHLHFEFAKLALQAGKHVILEKPITANADQFRALRQLATQTQSILLEAVTVHYLPAYRQLKTKLNRLGQIKIVSLNYSQYSSRYDRFKQGEILPVFDPKQAGGALMDLNVYNLHFAVGLFGKPKNAFYSANIECNIDTSGVLLLQYEGFQGVCIGAKDCAAPVMLSIQGDAGNITVPMPANGMDRFTLTANNGKSETVEVPTVHRMLPEFEQFIRIINEQDRQTAEQMLDISETVIDLLDQARRQAGIALL